MYTKFASHLQVNDSTCTLLKVLLLKLVDIRADIKNIFYYSDALTYILSHPHSHTSTRQVQGLLVLLSWWNASIIHTANFKYATFNLVLSNKYTMCHVDNSFVSKSDASKRKHGSLHGTRHINDQARGRIANELSSNKSVLVQT
jgi:hypothetical protein